MISIIVSSQEEMEAQIEEFLKLGFRLAAISNAGLPAGQGRLTFVPPEAFQKEGAFQKQGESNDLE